MILDPGFNLNLRPMKYPLLYKQYETVTNQNHWSVPEVKFDRDKEHLRNRIDKATGHMVKRLVAYFATGDSIVANNLVLNLYKHINSPEARMYLSQQLAEEARHIDFYLKLVEEYIPDEAERIEAFQAVENIPSIKKKAEWAMKWIDKMAVMDRLNTLEDRRTFVLGLIAFAACIEGLFFMGAFSYVYYLRSKGLLPGFAEGTDWVFRDETQHMTFALEIVDIARREEPELWNAEMERLVREMLAEAIECEMTFCEDAVGLGVLGFTAIDMRQFLEFCADARCVRLGMEPMYRATNPFDFMVLQDLQPLTNFFERTVAEYSMNTGGEVTFDEDF